MAERRKKAIQDAIKNECAFCAIHGNVANIMCIFASAMACSANATDSSGLVGKRNWLARFEKHSLTIRTFDGLKRHVLTEKVSNKSPMQFGQEPRRRLCRPHLGRLEKAGRD
jgi:hypothetical protein